VNNSLDDISLIVDAAIFDLDGTLIDSSDTYFSVIEEILKRLELPLVPREVLLEKMREGVESWGDLFPAESESWKKRLTKEAGTLFKELAPRMLQQNLKLIPGTPETLRQIFAKGIKIGLVTLTHLKYLDDKLYPLKKAGIADLIESIICIEDIPRVKPAPDSLIECAKRMSVLMDKCVYIGDSDIDIKAGRAAGMKTVGVLTGMDNYETLKKEGPDLIIDSVADLLKIIEPCGQAGSS